MVMCNIDRLAKCVEEKGMLINAPRALLSVHTRSKGDGTPHIEIVGSNLFYVSCERGYEIFRKQVFDENELLYLIFRDIAWKMASDFELKNRVVNRDSRRLIFSKKLELLEKICPEWKAREEEEIKKILLNAPYIDVD